MAAMEARLEEIMQNVGDIGTRAKVISAEVQDENADHNVQKPAESKDEKTGAKKEKKLQPSMQAWLASRSHAAGGLRTAAPVNVAPSEISVGSLESQALRHSRRRDSGISLSKSSRPGAAGYVDVSSEVKNQMRVDEARRQQSERVRRNAANCHQAIHNPDLPTRSDRGHVTLPHEFNLSVSNSRHHKHVPTSADDADVYIGEGGLDKQWKTSLRGEDSAPPTPTRGRSRSSSKPELTVPQGPRLRTASRSSSRHSSVGSGMESNCSTPLRGRSRSSSRSSTPLPAREKAAVEEYLQRMLASRTPSESPRRGGRMETPSPARSVSRGRGSWTPLRSMDRVSQSAPCTPRGYSVSSRLSELSRRTPSRSKLLSSAEQQVLQAEEWRRRLHKLRLDNTRSWREARESDGDVAGIGRAHAHNPELTVPHAPAFRTEGRSSRSRSSSRKRSVSRSLDTAGLAAHAVPKSEQRAMEKHVERMTGAEDGAVLKPPTGQDASEWARAGANAQECAERARAVVLSKRLQQESEEKARLCIFKTNAAKDGARSKTGAGVAAAGQKPNFVFNKVTAKSAAFKAKPNTEVAAEESASAPAASAAAAVAVATEESKEALPEAQQPAEEPEKSDAAAAAAAAAVEEEEEIQAADTTADVALADTVRKPPALEDEEAAEKREELSPLDLADKDKVAAGEAAPSQKEQEQEQRTTPRTFPEPRSLFSATSATARPSLTSRLGEPTRARPSAAAAAAGGESQSQSPKQAGANLKRPGFAAAPKSKALR